MKQFVFNARAVCLAALIILSTGCGPKQTTAPEAGTGGARSASNQTKSAISIKGSDTMVHLVTAWADAFMKRQPDVSLSVTGGGSGTGIAALLNGTTDICASSRELNEEERSTAQAKGLVLTEKVVARDALSIVVHPSNPINELTLEQIAQIFTGSVKNWSELGGPDAPIAVTSRESSSGTYLFFLEHVLKKQDYTQDALLLSATSAIVQTVSDSVGAIGYVGLGYAEGAAGKIKAIGVKATADGPVVLPSMETVLNGQYSISRPLYMVVSRGPAGSVKDFLDYTTSPEGAAIVEEAGYVKVQ